MKVKVADKQEGRTVDGDKTNIHKQSHAHSPWVSYEAEVERAPVAVALAWL